MSTNKSVFCHVVRRGRQAEPGIDRRRTIRDAEKDEAAAQDAGITASREMAMADGRLPDPGLKGVSENGK